MAKGSKAAAKSWLVMAPFQPLTPAETWIRKAQWLLKHGQYGAAKEMVDKVLRPAALLPASSQPKPTLQRTRC